MQCKNVSVHSAWSKADIYDGNYYCADHVALHGEPGAVVVEGAYVEQGPVFVAPRCCVMVDDKPDDADPLREAVERFLIQAPHEYAKCPAVMELRRVFLETRATTPCAEPSAK